MVFKKIFSIILSVFFAIACLTLPVFATYSLTDEVVEFSIAEPPADSNTGYFVLFYRTTSGSIMARLLSWCIVPYISVDSTYNNDNGSVTEDSTDTTYMKIDLNMGNIRFYPKVSEISIGYYSVVDVFSDTNEYNNISYGTCYSDVSPYYEFDLSDNTVLGYVVYGNGIIYENSHKSATELYPVLFNDSKTTFNQLHLLINACQLLHTDNNKLLNKLDDILSQTMEINAYCLEIYTYLYTYLPSIESLIYDTNTWLNQCYDVLIEIRDSLNYDPGVSYDDMQSDDFQNAMGDYNSSDAFGSLPDLSDGDTAKIYNGIGFFKLVFNEILFSCPELRHALTFILLIGFVGYVIGRKLNKEA